jgi:hypothetical protein
MMKKILGFLFTILTFSSALAQDSWNKEPYQVQTFTGSIDHLEVRTSGGNIVVEGSQRNDIKVEVFIRGNESKKTLSNAEIKKILEDNYEIKMVQESNHLLLSAKNKKQNSWKNGLSVSFTVFVPETISTNLTTSGGNIVLTGLNGKQEFTTSGGNLQLNRLKGKINGVTSGGNIQVTDASDDIDLATSGGSIKAENCNGKMELTTSGGNLELSGLNGNVTATTSGGNVDGNNIRGSLNAGTSGGNVSLLALYCDIKAATSGGNITVQVKEPGKYITLGNSSGGRTELQIPGNKGYNLDIRGDKISTSALSNFNGKAEENSLEGTLNGGGTAVKVKSNGGKINLVLQ